MQGSIILCIRYDPKTLTRICIHAHEHKHTRNKYIRILYFIHDFSQYNYETLFVRHVEFLKSTTPAYDERKNKIILFDDV